MANSCIIFLKELSNDKKSHLHQFRHWITGSNVGLQHGSSGWSCYYCCTGILAKSDSGSGGSSTGGGGSPAGGASSKTITNAQMQLAQAMTALQSKNTTGAPEIT
jgi:hypothetical protein